MIVTAKAHNIQAKATPIGRRTGHIGTAYQVGKRLVDIAGFSKNIEPYLPETYYKRYRYKPLKRTSSKIAQTIQKSYAAYYKHGKARVKGYSRRRNDEYCKNNSKSGHCSK